MSINARAIDLFYHFTVSQQHRVAVISATRHDTAESASRLRPTDLHKNIQYSDAVPHFC